ncbi:MAG: glycerol-3-phosphate acyltransferase [Lachnospiraceae bacterium]|nr:glycerol-3-phosphate acyltransferase [Lachnospiraceae bacterium]
MIIRLTVLLIGYVFGNFETSFFIGKKRGIDIREHGSGNAGTTNALRVMGSKAGVITFLGDLGKMLAAYLAVWLIFGRNHPDMILLLKLYTGLGVVLGHDFPALMKFRGGKGIAVTGSLMILLDWRTGILAAVLFLGILWFTHLASLASLTMVTVNAVLVIIFAACGIIERGVLSLAETAAVIGTIWLLAVIMHRENIKRLLSGTENKIFLSAYAKKRDAERAEKREVRREKSKEPREEKKES